MMRDKVYRNVFFYLGIILVLALLVYMIFIPNYTHLRKLREENALLEKESAKLREEITLLRDNLKSLEEDDFLWEKLARKNLGVIKKEEIIVDIRREKE